jgi:hypothetical protein
MTPYKRVSTQASHKPVHRAAANSASSAASPAPFSSTSRDPNPKPRYHDHDRERRTRQWQRNTMTTERRRRRSHPRCHPPYARSLPRSHLCSSRTSHRRLLLRRQITSVSMALRKGRAKRRGKSPPSSVRPLARKRPPSRTCVRSA